MRFPENFQELFVRDFVRIKFNLDDLGVAGDASADLFVSRILLCAAGVAAGHGLHAVQSFEDGFQAPETAAAEGGQLSFVGRVHFLVGGSVCASRDEGRHEQQPDCIFHSPTNFVEAVLRILHANVATTLLDFCRPYPRDPGVRPTANRRIFRDAPVGAVR